MNKTYSQRATLSSSLLGKKLFHLMDEKQTNLALSADVTTSSELIDLATKIGPEICMLKTHIDIIEDFSFGLIETLQQLAKQHHFLLCEDRKFADIGNTVKHQYEGGMYRIANWADLVTVHSLPGPGILQGIAAGRKQAEQGVLLLAEMSSAGHLMGADYFENSIKMAEHFPELVTGFITQRGISPQGIWISMTPGVQLSSKEDSLGQKYISPQKAVFDNHSDVIIVGRGILSESDRLAAAQNYRQAGWEAYQLRTATP